jgi:hypothetical protein
MQGPVRAGQVAITVGIDDSPTSRYGKHVEGAGVHHHPTLFVNQCSAFLADAVQVHVRSVDQFVA